MNGRVRRWLCVLAVAALVPAACGQHPGIHADRLELSTAAAQAPLPPVPENSAYDGFTTGERAEFDSVTAVRAKRGKGRTDRARGGRGDQGAVILSPRGVEIPEAQAVVTDLDGDGIPDEGTLVVYVIGDGPVLTCPVYGRGYYTSSFGAYRAGPPPHLHQGNDIFAPYGTPIVAPFDGYAVATPNRLGGLAVKVYGADGYVYNAHLAAYGKLGPVRLGDPIGFVGNTGNAQTTAPHNHFEWHPDNGSAVDPFSVLNQVCVGPVES